MREVLCGVSGVSGCGEWKVGGLVGGWTGYNSYRLCGFCCSLVGYGEDEIYLDTAFFTYLGTAVLEIRCPCSTGLKIASIAFTTVWKNPRFAPVKAAGAVLSASSAASGMKAISVNERQMQLT